MVWGTGGSERVSVTTGERAKRAGTRVRPRDHRLGRPTEARPGDRQDLLPIGIAVVLVVSLTGLWKQLIHPFISHDDWDFLLPVESGRSQMMHQRLFWEGRLLNWLAWRGPGHLLTPVTATLIFELSFLAIVAALSWRWAPGWLSVPTTVALFTSPMITQVSFWPATLWLSMLLGAIAVVVLPRCALNDRDLALWIVFATYLTFLSYPPMTWMLFVVLMVELIDRQFRVLVLATVGYGLSYAAATLTVFTFNKDQFGKFGLDYQSWRKPHQVHSLADLGENLRRCGGQLGNLWSDTTLGLVIGAVALGVCFLLPELRVRAARWVLVVVVLVGLTSSGTILAGVTNPYRAYGAVWLLIIPPVIWLVSELGARREVRAGALVALVVLAGWGVKYAHHGYDYNQQRRETFQRDEDKIMDVVRQQPGAPVVLIGSDADWKYDPFTEEGLYLIGKLENDHGIRVVPCLPSNCDIWSRTEVQAQIDSDVSYFPLHGVTLIWPSQHKNP